MMQPFFRWVGSKRRIAPRIVKLLPKRGRYIEPFCGSAAIFFALEPDEALLSDTNEDLVTCLRCVRSNWKEVEERTNAMILRGADASMFWAVKRRVPDEAYARAARFLYLQATSFNGIWRENQAAEYNVPCGHRQNIQPYALREHALTMRAARVVRDDAVNIVREAGRGDRVYLDPPYADTFDGYTPNGWTPLHLAELIDAALDARDRGATLVASDSDTPLVRSLYKRARKIHIFEHAQTVAASADAREPRRELLVLV